MGEIRNARCLLLQQEWNQYGDPRVDPICRSQTGSITPITTWILYADHQVDPIGRSLTERLDLFNGLLLAPHLDALFDGGWVTFLDSGQMKISDTLDTDSRARLGVTGAENIYGLTERHLEYLAWHREHCFRQKSQSAS